MRKAWACSVFLQLFIAGMLSACGGGGGGGGSTPPGMPASPAPPPPPPPTFPAATTSEYLADPAIANSGAIAAWQRGATGQGVTVAVIDEGVDKNDPELDANVTSAIDINSGRNTPFDPTRTHGSDVTSIIAGEFNGSKTVGVAFNAHILSVRADSTIGSGNFNESDLISAINYARSQNVQVINMSLGAACSGGVCPQASASFESALQAATAAGIVVVMSAGNDGLTSPPPPGPQYPAAYAANPTISNGLIIAVGAHDLSGLLSDFSNPAGAVQNFYVAALGRNIVVPDFGNAGASGPGEVCASGLCNVAGTSFSAPQVAGAIALLEGTFPGLTPAQAVQILLTTATDAGAPGVDAVYGRGLLNIANMFQPIGTLSVPLGGDAGLTAGSVSGVTGAAFGDAMSAHANEWRVAGFDAYGRAFNVNIANTWRPAPRPEALEDAPLLWRQMKTPDGVSASFAPSNDFAPQTRLGLVAYEQSRPAMNVEAALTPTLSFAVTSGGVAPLAAAAPEETEGHLAFAGAEMGMRLTNRLSRHLALSLSAQGGENDLGFAEMHSARRGEALRLDGVFDRLRLAFTYGAVSEDGALMGMAWTSNLGQRLSGETRFGGVAASYALNDALSLGFEAERGAVSGAGGSWLRVADQLSTSAYTAALRYAPARGGAVTFSVRQPLRIEGGALAALLPTADEYGRQSLRYETRLIDPTPSGREIQVGLAYDYRVGRDLAFHAALQRIFEPGHVADAEPVSAFSFGLRMAY